MANTEHFELYEGAPRNLTMHARDSTNVPRDLTGLTLTCRVGRPPNVPWQDSAVFCPAAAVSDASSGTFIVAILTGATAGLHGEYMHQTTDQNGVVLTEGRLKIRRTIDS